MRMFIGQGKEPKERLRQMRCEGMCVSGRGHRGAGGMYGRTHCGVGFEKRKDAYLLRPVERWGRTFLTCRSCEHRELWPILTDNQISPALSGSLNCSITGAALSLNAYSLSGVWGKPQETGVVPRKKIVPHIHPQNEAYFSKVTSSRLRKLT